MQKIITNNTELKPVQKREREFGVDALKVLSMFFIVILHILGQGGVLESLEEGSLPYHVMWIMEIGAFCAVNCYGIVSGYVGIGSKKYKFSNLLYLWLQVLFYTVVITLVFVFVKPEVVTSVRIRAAVFPVIFRQYWYFSAYVLLFLMMPVLNLVMDKLKKETVRFFITILTVTLSVPQIFFARDPFTVEGGYNALWLMVLYLIGAYLKKYNVLKKFPTAVWGLIYAFAVWFTWFLKAVMEGHALSIEFFLSFAQNSLISYLSPTILLSAIALAGVFVNLNPKKGIKKAITRITPYAFGVYLIHVHQLIWAEIRCSLEFMAGMPLIAMFVYVILTAVAVFGVCALIDAFRERIFRLFRVKQILQWFEKRFIKNVWENYRD